MGSQALATDVGRKISLEFTQNSLIMSTLYGQSLIVMEYVKTVLCHNFKALDSHRCI